MTGLTNQKPEVTMLPKHSYEIKILAKESIIS